MLLRKTCLHLGPAPSEVGQLEKLEIMFEHLPDVLNGHWTELDLHVDPAGSDEGAVQPLRVVRGDDQHPAIHLHHTVQQLHPSSVSRGTF